MKSLTLRRTASIIAAAGLIGWMAGSHADDSATVFQYELRLGGGHPVTSAFYLSLQPEGADPGAEFDTTSPARLPLFSSDPGERTMFSQLSVAMHAAENGRTSSSEMGAMVLGLILYLGIPLYAVAKELDEGWDWDLPETEMTTTTPAGGSADSTASGAKQ